MPLNPNLKLAENILEKAKLEQKPTREGYGLGLVKAGEEDSRAVALDMDL